jgi:hypothetical protein
MTYHHLNRVKAHLDHNLTPAERLLAWHFAYETRQDRSYYSESLRRLETSLGFDRRTLQKALQRLVDLKVLDRINKTGTHAPLYRLLIQCPPYCLDLSDHNTKPELEALELLGGTNTPPLNSIHTAPYIEKREEEDKPRVYFEGETELGYLLGNLEAIPQRDQQQNKLWDLAHTKPKAMAKAVLTVLGTSSTPLDTGRRRINYLLKVVRLTPQNLLKFFEEEEAAERGNALIRNSNEEQATKAGNRNFTPSSTPDRVNSYAKQVLEGFEPKKTSYYLNSFGLDLTAKQVFAAAHLEAILEEFSKYVSEDFWRKGWLKLNDQKLPELVYEYGSFLISDEVAETLLTEEEKQAYQIRTAGLELLRETWNEAHKEEAGSVKFYSSEEALEFMRANPLPDHFGDGQILLKQFNKQLALQVSEYLEAPEAAEDPQGTYRDYLKEHFTIDDDLNDLLRYIAERPEGHSRYFKQTKKAYLNALKYLTQDELKLRAVKEFGFSKREVSQYWKAPNTWLDDQVASHTNTYEPRT